MKSSGKFLPLAILFAAAFLCGMAFSAKHGATAAPSAHAAKKIDSLKMAENLSEDYEKLNQYVSDSSEPTPHAF